MSLAGGHFGATAAPSNHHPTTTATTTTTTTFDVDAAAGMMPPPATTTTTGSNSSAADNNHHHHHHHHNNHHHSNTTTSSLAAAAAMAAAAATLETPRALFTTPGGIGEFPTTAELMQKCLAVNPFEAQFRSANRRISQSSSQDVLELHGLVPSSTTGVGGAAAAAAVTANSTMALLQKAIGVAGGGGGSSLGASSPSIFSNIAFLTTDSGDDKTAEITRLVQQMKENGCGGGGSGGDSAAAPRTADVLNAVLDMQKDRLHMLNYLNLASNPRDILSSLTPGGSAPSSAGILGLPAGATVVTSISTPPVIAHALSVLAPSFGSTPNMTTLSVNTTTGLPPSALANPGPTGTAHISPHRALDANLSAGGLLAPRAAAAISAVVSAVSPLSRRTNNVTNSTAISSNSTATTSIIQPAPVALPAASSSTSSTMAAAALAAAAALSDTSSTAGVWNDMNDVKPQLIDDDALSHYSQQSDMTPRSTGSSKQSGRAVSAQPSTSQHGGETGRPTKRGRGRGRTTAIADMDATERRQTILERNKAAAVRYRKRKKEEHDDMMGRVHLLEQDRNQLYTQNESLRREVERLGVLLRLREQRCACLGDITSEALAAQLRARGEPLPMPPPLPPELAAMPANSHASFANSIPKKPRHGHV